MRVDWLDSYEASHWTHLTELGPIEAQPIITVGILLGESETAIRVTGHYGASTRTTDEQACGVMTIPRCCIQSLVVIGDTEGGQANA